MTKQFELKITLPASPKDIYDAWLDSEKHSLMTGGSAEVSTEPGALFSAWDEYISGKNLELIPHEKIVQSWRTTEFQEHDDDSKLELILVPVSSDCELTLIHTNIPDNQPDYEQGWKEHYFEPMMKFFVAD